MPKFSIEVPSDWPTVWPAANLSPGQWLRVELADNGDLVDLSGPLVNISADEFNALLDHVGIGARGDGPMAGASPSTEPAWVAHVEPIEEADSLVPFTTYCYNCDEREEDHATEGCNQWHPVNQFRIHPTLIDPLVKAVTEVAAERPDYIYPKGVIGDCKYVYHDDGVTTRCVLGEAFHRLGVSDDLLAEFDDAPDSGILNLFSGYDPRVGVLRDAQKRQDEGTPWGELPALIHRGLENNERQAKRKG